MKSIEMIKLNNRVKKLEKNVFFIVYIDIE